MKYPLRYVVPVMLLVVGLAAAVAVALTSLRLSHASTEKLVSEFITTIGNHAAADVEAGLRRNNPARMRDAIDKLQMLRGLELAVLVNGENEVVFTSTTRMTGRVIDSAEEPVLASLLEEARQSRSQARRLGPDSVYYSNHVGGSVPLAVGSRADDLTLLLAYNLAQAEAGQRSAAINQALIIGVTVLALSFACWMFLSNALFGRIASLADASRRIGEGELRTPIRVEGHDEIAVLARALDTMRIDLSDKQSQLHLAAEDLEAANAAVESQRELLAQRVEERTRDLTLANRELARAKEEAEAASRAKSAFLATVSHEIRTPMNGVLGAMELLERSGLDRSRASLLRTAQESASSLLGLLNDLLDMAKIEAGRIEIVEAPASLYTIVERVIATYTPAATARRTRMIGHVDPRAPEWVCTDALRLQQILGNFVSNAVKFTDEGSIELRVSADGFAEADGQATCRLTFTVEDSGTGIEPEALSRLFRPFEQGSIEIARSSGGTGLGLAISSGLAEQLGGTVDLESSPGEGTVATLELPVRIAGRPQGSDRDEGRSGSTSIMALLNRDDNRSGDDKRQVQVLVVDDHPVNRLLQVRQIEQLGAAADTASDGVGALSKLRQKRFDIVVTDCEMPHMDGFELARAIRASDQPLRDVPIIACTAHALPDVDRQCRLAGMNDVLTKPMRLDDLAAVLRKYWPDISSPPATEPHDEEPASEVLDTAALDLLAGGDFDLRCNMMRAFVEDHWRTLDAAASAVDSADFERCREIGHRNKGACAVFGARALEEAFADFEHWAVQQPAVVEQLKRTLERLRREGRRLESLLAADLPRPGALSH